MKVDKNEKMINPFCCCLLAEQNKPVFHFVRADGGGAVFLMLIHIFNIFKAVAGGVTFGEEWHVDVLLRGLMVKEMRLAVMQYHDRSCRRSLCQGDSGASKIASKR